MTLKAFHVVFISASVLLAFFFGAWCLDTSPAPGAGRILAGVASIVVGFGLAAYEAWALRKVPSRVPPPTSRGTRRMP
jgi:hypothetical protein